MRTKNTSDTEAAAKASREVTTAPGAESRMLRNARAR